MVDVLKALPHGDALIAWREAARRWPALDRDAVVDDGGDGDLARVTTQFAAW